MSDFRKNLHLAYKKKMCNILFQFTADLLHNMQEFSKEPEEWVKNWVNKNFLPMGDFSREDAVKEIDAWQEEIR